MRSIGVGLRERLAKLHAIKGLGLPVPRQWSGRNYPIIVTSAAVDRAPRGSPGVRRKVVLQGETDLGAYPRSAVSLGFGWAHGGWHLRWDGSRGQPFAAAWSDQTTATGGRAVSDQAAAG